MNQAPGWYGGDDLSRSSKNAISVFLVLFSLIICTGCQQVRDIPEEIPEQLPNPVRDFTQKDRYLIGLSWYRQRNYDIAAKFWKPLSTEGDCDAEYAMGLLYFEGLGVGKSFGRAIDLWKRSAEQGQAQAQISLGVVFARISIPYTALDCKNGCGEDKKLAVAYKWFGIASEIGSPHEMKVATDSLSQILPEMTPDEIARGEEMVKAWKPVPVNCQPRGIYLVEPR